MQSPKKNRMDSKASSLSSLEVDGYRQNFKLEADNKGILFAAISLNMIFLPSIAATICNSINGDDNLRMADAYFKQMFQIFHNTLLNARSEYADVKILVVPNAKTVGDKGG